MHRLYITQSVSVSGGDVVTAQLCTGLILCLRFVTPLPLTKEYGMEYLYEKGYSEESPGAYTDQDALRMAILDFQDTAGVTATGDLDRATLEAMMLPRCGNPDQNMTGDEKTRKKRYAVQGSRWESNRITYRFRNYTPDIRRSTLVAEIERAFKVWSDVTPLTFVRVYERADIEILFAHGNHGDGLKFDGRGGTLAHAFSPQFGGDAHFDEAEYFTFNSSTGVDLFLVAAHEFGHSLGLYHSRVKSALMSPFYREYVPNFKLHPDDIAGIQKIYGTPGGGNNKLDICNITRLDAATYFPINKRTYIFLGEMYYRLNDDGPDEGYPREISRYWGGIKGPVDAALTTTDLRNETYLFKGNQYWRFVNGGIKPGYPKTIGKDGFHGLPNDIDSSFVWGGNGRVYFIKGNKYYRLSKNVSRYEDGNIDKHYPRPLTVWKGLPSGVNAAIQWSDHKTYFFIGSEYYRFDDRNLKVDDDSPLVTKNRWFGC